MAVLFESECERGEGASDRELGRGAEKNVVVEGGGSGEKGGRGVGGEDGGGKGGGGCGGAAGWRWGREVKVLMGLGFPGV